MQRCFLLSSSASVSVLAAIGQSTPIRVEDGKSSIVHYEKSFWLLFQHQALYTEINVLQLTALLLINDWKHRRCGHYLCGYCHDISIGILWEDYLNHLTQDFYILVHPTIQPYIDRHVTEFGGQEIIRKPTCLYQTGSCGGKPPCQLWTNKNGYFSCQFSYSFG